MERYEPHQKLHTLIAEEIDALRKIYSEDELTIGVKMATVAVLVEGAPDFITKIAVLAILDEMYALKVEKDRMLAVAERVDRFRQHMHTMHEQFSKEDAAALTRDLLAKVSK